VEEVESIATASPVLSTYLDILDAMLQHQENMLYIDPLLDRLPAATVSRVQPVSVPAHIAARMFYMNLQTWRSNKFIRDNYPSPPSTGWSTTWKPCPATPMPPTRSGGV
jgi:hypothetical protein